MYFNLIKPLINTEGVPRGTVGTSDEGFGGLVGYDACLTRRRSSVRLRPEIQLFFCTVVKARENIICARLSLNIYASTLFYAKKKTSVFREKNVHTQLW